MAGLLTPLALALGLLAGPIIILYMLKLRRREVLVSSTFLWQLVVRDREANAPWQRLRRNLLLILQLLILIALVLSLARPWLVGATVAQGSLIVLLDTSASMAATDAQPSRLAAAQGIARTLVDALGVQDALTLIAVGAQPRVLASQSADKGALYAALDGLRAEQSPADWEAAFALAIAQARSVPNVTTVIISDGGLPTTLPSLPGSVRFAQVGTSDNNLAISALAARPASGGTELYVGLSNAGAQPAETLVDITLDGTLYDAKSVPVPARGTSGLLLQLPPTARVIRAHIAQGGALSYDDEAWAVVPQQSGGRVLMVTPGNVFLEKALAFLPGVTSFRADPTQPLPTGQYDVTILDGVLPVSSTLPTGDLLMIGPPRSTSVLTLTGVFSNTTITHVADHTLMRYVDTTNLHILRARKVALPTWATPLIEAEGGPLFFAGFQGQRQVAVLTFDLHDSDLPLQIAFPILLANLMEWYAPANLFDAPNGLAPGQPLVLTPPADTTELFIEKPDGTIWRRTIAAGDLTFIETDQLGAYTVHALTPGGEVKQVFAVNLFSPEESDIAPRAELVLPGAAPITAVTAQEPGQVEIWPWLAAAALLVSALEWWVYHRGMTFTWPQWRPWRRAQTGPR